MKTEYNNQGLKKLMKKYKISTTLSLKEKIQLQKTTTPVYAHACIHTHTYMHTHMHVRARTHTHARTHLYMRYTHMQYTHTRTHFLSLVCALRFCIVHLRTGAVVVLSQLQLNMGENGPL